MRGSIGERIIADFDLMPGATFFPDATLNFADNLLADRGDGVALVFKGEGRPVRTITHGELYRAVAAFAAALLNEGIRPGDRVAGYLPNLPETIVAALGTAAVGAVSSSCSPDFGARGVLDRFGQIEPKVLVAAAGYWYGGKRLDSSARVAEVVTRAPVGAADRDDSLPRCRHDVRNRECRGLGGVPGCLQRATICGSSRFHSTIRCSFSFHPARPVCPSASSTARAARSSNISRSTSCSATFEPAIASSTSRRAAG